MLTTKQCMELVESRDWLKDADIVGELLHPDAGGGLLMSLETRGRTIMWRYLHDETQTREMRGGEIHLGQIGGWDGGCRCVDDAAAAFILERGAKNMRCKAGAGAAGGGAAGRRRAGYGRTALRGSFVLRQGVVGLLGLIGWALIAAALGLMTAAVFVDWLQGKTQGGEVERA